MIKSIGCYNPKGGVGKTTISVTLAKMLNLTYVTNDEYCSGEDEFPEGKGFLIPEGHHEIPYSDNVVFDLGGFKDKRIKPLLLQLDKVIVPTLESTYDMKGLTAILKALSEINSSVVILINNIEANYSNKKGKYEHIDLLEEDIMKIIEDNKLTFKSLQFTRIRKTSFVKLRDNKDKKTVFDFCGDNKMLLHRYRNFIEDLQAFENAVMN